MNYSEMKPEVDVDEWEDDSTSSQLMIAAEQIMQQREDLANKRGMQAGKEVQLSYTVLKAKELGLSVALTSKLVRIPEKEVVDMWQFIDKLGPTLE